MLHKGDDLRDGALAKGLRSTDAEDTREVHTTGDDFITDIHVARQGLPRQGNSIQGTRTLDDHTIQRHLLTRLDHDDRTHSNVLRTDVLSVHMGDVRTDVHEVGDAVAGLALSVTLEEFTNLKEKHHEYCLGVLGLGSGKETDEQGTDSGDGHEEMFVEGVTVGDTLPCLVQRLVAY